MNETLNIPDIHEMGETALTGKITLELVNPDGSVAHKSEHNNAVKTPLIAQGMQNMANVPQYVMSPAAAFGHPHRINYYHNYGIYAIGLFNDATGTADDKQRLDEGELVGYFNLHRDNGDGSDPVMGNRVKASWTGAYNADGSKTYTYVGEFFSEQANGEFNKIGFITGGEENRIHPQMLRDRATAAYRIWPTHAPYRQTNYFDAENFAYEPYAMVGRRSTEHYSGTLTTHDASFLSMIQKPDVNGFHQAMITEHGNKLYGPTAYTVKERGAQGIQIRDWHSWVDIADSDTAYQEHETVLDISAKAGLDESTGRLGAAYDSVNNVYYFAHLEDATSILTITPFDCGNGWAEQPQLTVDLGIAATYESLALCINPTGNKLHLYTTEKSGGAHYHGVVNVTKSSATLVHFRKTNAWVYKNYDKNSYKDSYGIGGTRYVRDILAISDNVVLVSFCWETNPEAAINEFFASTSTKTGRRFVYIDTEQDVCAPSNMVQYTGYMSKNDWDDADGDKRTMYPTNENLYHDDLVSGTAGMAPTGAEGFRYLGVNGFDGSLGYICGSDSSEHIANKKNLTYWQVPYSPTSASMLLSSAAFPAVTKVPGQTLKVSYAITVQPVQNRFTLGNTLSNNHEGALTPVVPTYSSSPILWENNSALYSPADFNDGQFAISEGGARLTITGDGTSNDGQIYLPSISDKWHQTFFNKFVIEMEIINLQTSQTNNLMMYLRNYNNITSSSYHGYWYSTGNSIYGSSISYRNPSPAYSRPWVTGDLIGLVYTGTKLQIWVNGEYTGMEWYNLYHKPVHNHEAWIGFSVPNNHDTVFDVRLRTDASRDGHTYGFLA